MRVACGSDLIAYTSTLRSRMLAEGCCGVESTEIAVKMAVQKATVVKKPKTFWPRTKEECILVVKLQNRWATRCKSDRMLRRDSQRSWRSLGSNLQSRTQCLVPSGKRTSLHVCNLWFRRLCIQVSTYVQLPMLKACMVRG